MDQISAQPAVPALRRVLPSAGLAALLGLGLLGGLSQSTRAPGEGERLAGDALRHAALLPSPEPLPALDHGAVNLLRGALIAAGSEKPATGAAEPAPGETSGSVAAVEAPPAELDAKAEVPAAEAPPPVAQTVPLPVPRPPEFRNPAMADALRRFGRLAARAPQAAAPAPQSEDDRNFFEKFFGIQRSPPSTALGYAALETAPLERSPRLPLSPAPRPGGGIAVYDITARIVTLPNGERLEAHSGLGESMDNPDHVHVRMRGATPPGVYDLTEREALFHGVRAIRLTPVGGAGAIYGRAGLLAHTYMLGPSGASNGCISFRNYDRFLQAYLRGEIARVVVVTGRPGDAPPAIANGGTPVRTAKAGNDA